jgi:hypothetical protein
MLNWELKGILEEGLERIYDHCGKKLAELS